MFPRTIFMRATALLVMMLMVSMAAAADFSLFHCRNMGGTHAARCCPAEQAEPQAAILAAECCEAELVEIDAPRSLSSHETASIRPAVVLGSIDVPQCTGSIARIERAIDGRDDARPPPLLLLKCVLLV